MQCVIAVLITVLASACFLVVPKDKVQEIRRLEHWNDPVRIDHPHP